MKYSNVLYKRSVLQISPHETCTDFSGHERLGWARQRDDGDALGFLMLRVMTRVVVWHVASDRTGEDLLDSVSVRPHGEHRASDIQRLQAVRSSRHTPAKCQAAL